MKKTMKRVVAGALALSMTVLMAACGGSGESTVSSGSAAQPSSGSTAGAATIKVWVSSGAEDEVYRETFDKMETELGITINDEYYPKDELDSKLQVAPVVGDAPDLIVADYLQMPAYYEAGMIQPVDEYISEDLKSDLLQSVIDESTYDGKMISTAQFDSGMAMWANKSMLEEAGVRIPTSYTDAWTKEEFEDALAKLKATGVEYPLYIRQNKPSSLYYTYMPVIASFGGDYVNRDTMLATGTLDSPETVAAFDYISWLCDEGYMNPACDYEDGFYGRKESAIALLGHWKYTEHVNALGDDAIIIPIPDFGNGVFTCTGSTVWAMTTAAVDNGVADAVWSVMEKSMEPEYITLVTDFNGAIPSRYTVMEEDPELQEGGRLYLYREQLEANIVVLRPLTPAHMTIYSAMESVFADVIAGADASEALSSAAQSIDDIIVENGWNIE